jgi:phosphoribosyl 1,2-cyclic phosphodiesterase
MKINMIYNPTHQYQKNDLIIHPTFGEGIVQRVYENKIEVVFDNAGIKQLRNGKDIVDRSYIKQTPINNHKITVRVLASSSAGNATLITCGDRAIMIDCGLTLDYLDKYISKFGNFIPQIDALIITHAHIDHAGGTAIKKFAEKNIAIYCHKQAKPRLNEEWHIIKSAKNKGLLKVFDKTPFETAGFVINHFDVEHDTDAHCCGFCISPKGESVNKKITIATDLGNFNEQVLNHFIDSDVIILESNYDYDMLIASDRPEYLKTRIQNTHLSNKKCAQAIDQILESTNKIPKHIFLAHISDECNTPELAYNETNKIMDKHKSKQIRLVLSHKDKVSDVVVI